jgi:hypothetical protein
MGLEIHRDRADPERLDSRLVVRRVRSLWDYTRMPSDIIRQKAKSDRVREQEHRRRLRRAIRDGVHPMNRPLRR